MRAHVLFWSLSSLVGISCHSGEPSAPAPEPSSGAETASGPTPAMDRKMWHHFFAVADARDAVIDGNPQGVREPLERIAAGSFGVDEMPPDWLPWAEEMQQEAARGPSVRTIEEAANVVAAVAQRCGDCHRATRGGPELVGDLQEFDAHGRTGVSGAMAQHVWASEELWLGMTVPNHQSWVAGAKALSATPLLPLKAEAGSVAPAVESAPAPATADTSGSTPPTPAGAPTEEGVDAEMQAQLDGVRGLGARALAAGKPFEMTNVYAELIGRCGNCHASRR